MTQPNAVFSSTETESCKPWISLCDSNLVLKNNAYSSTSGFRDGESAPQACNTRLGRDPFTTHIGGVVHFFTRVQQTIAPEANISHEDRRVRGSTIQEQQ